MKLVFLNGQMIKSDDDYTLTRDGIRFKFALRKKSLLSVLTFRFFGMPKKHDVMIDRDCIANEMICL
jgi:hypothetical protein